MVAGGLLKIGRLFLDVEGLEARQPLTRVAELHLAALDLDAFELEPGVGATVERIHDSQKGEKFSKRIATVSALGKLKLPGLRFVAFVLTAELGDEVGFPKVGSGECGVFYNIIRNARRGRTG